MRYGTVRGELFTTRCACGKIDAASEAEARRIREAIAFIMGEDHDVRYYPCRIPGHWHWTRITGDAPICSCGRRAFPTPAAATAFATTLPPARGLRPVPYACPFGSHHVAWYPVGVHLRQCPGCKTISYPTRHHATLVATHLERTGTHATIHQCERERWHLTTRKRTR